MEDFIEKRQIEAVAKYRVLVNYLTILIQNEKSYIDIEKIKLILQALGESE